MQPISVTSPTASATATLLAAAPADIPIFAIAIVIEDGKYKLKVDIGLIHGGLCLQGDTITCQPGVGERPFVCRIQFRAPFLFASDPVRWTEPAPRPTWIGEAAVDVSGKIVDMLLVNATDDSQAATFRLIPRSPDLSMIDPTIVNNPPH